MKLIKYVDFENQLPKQGKIAVAYQEESNIIVYQAYNEKIAKYAIENQKIGGEYFSKNRMTWIKPNFLWMMYRSGWASKENQTRILAIWISKKSFDELVSKSVLTSYNSDVYKNEEGWKQLLQERDIRVQWDPSHDAYGNKLDRKAIQIGIKGKMLDVFINEMIIKIEDITEFVKEEKHKLDSGNEENVLIPHETIYV